MLLINAPPTNRISITFLRSGECRDYTPNVKLTEIISGG